MNWTQHQKYSPIYRDFIAWYETQVDTKSFFSLTEKEAENIDSYLRCFHNVCTNDRLFSTAKRVYLGIKTNETKPIQNNLPAISVTAKKASIDTSGWICVYCEEVANTVDHLVPLSKGGTNDKRNLAHCCSSCNGQKGNFTLTEFSILLDRLIFQSNEMGHTDIVGKYGLMLLNVNKLLIYEEKHIGKIFKPEKPTKRRSVTKRSLRSPLNMSEIKLNAPKPKKHSAARAHQLKKARAVIEQLERPKIYISEHVPYHTPKPKLDVFTPSYLDKQIAIARAAGFEKLWMYEQAHPELCEYGRLKSTSQ